MAERERKILMVVLCFLPESIGGTELYTYHLSQELKKRGYDVAVLTGLQDLSIDRYKVIHTTFEGLRVIKVVNSFYYTRTFKDFFIDETIGRIFRDIVEREKPDIIHFQHLPFLSGNLPEIADELKVPSVFTIHDYWYMCFRSQLIRPRFGPCPGPKGGVYCASCHDPVIPNPSVTPKFGFLSRLLRSRLVAKLNPKERLSPQMIEKIKSILYKQPATEVTAEAPANEETIKEHVFRYEYFRRQFEFPRFVLSPSYHLKKRYEDEGYREILHMPLGFYRTERVKSIPFDGTLKIAYLGNIVPFKGAIVILREIMRLRNRDGVELHIHGRPVNEIYFDEVKQFARQFPEGKVSIHGGYRSDKEMHDILSKVHLVVFPSLWEENYPLVVRETLLHGVPVIGSKLGGVPEAIVDGVNGFLFDPYREGDLSEKLDRVLDNPGILHEITAGARNTNIERMEDHIEKIIRIYEDAFTQ
ncbi:MAG: glycosyltransferase [Chloroflexota bacterium]